MTYLATITSRGQVTLPANLFRTTKFRRGERVILSVEGGQVKMQSAIELVNELAGSIKVPAHLRGRNLDEIIEESKMEYFRKKGSMK